MANPSATLTVSTINDSGLNVINQLVAQLNQLIADFNALTVVSRPFQTNTAVVVGNLIVDSNNGIQEVTTAGTTQASGTPAWATVVGNTTTSGTAVFTLIGTAPFTKAAQISLEV